MAASGVYVVYITKIKIKHLMIIKQAYMAYKSRLNIIDEVYWLKLSYYSLFYSLF